MANTQSYGLLQLIDLGELNPNQTAATADSELLTSGILVDAAQHNADIDALTRLFAEPTNDYQLEVGQAGGGRSQPVDENGRAIPVKPLAPYTVAFPLQGSGTAMGYNYITGQRMTVRDMAKLMSTMYRGDFNWVADQILGRLLTNVDVTHRDITGRGSLTIKPLANADATLYYRSTTGTTATDTHYIAQAAAIADATNPFSTLKAELLEHPDNGGEIISFIPTASVATATALVEFNSATIDPDIQLGANTDRLVGSLNATLPPGATVLGKTDGGVWIVEWPRLPSNFIVSITTEGRRPLARRQFPEASLQGFKSVGQRDDFPYFEDQWQRWEGYGVLNRAGAVITRTGDASYAVPTGYTVPLP